MMKNKKLNKNSDGIRMKMNLNKKNVLTCLKFHPQQRLDTLNH
jgi:hypothetical protein